MAANFTAMRPACCRESPDVSSGKSSCVPRVPAITTARIGLHDPTRPVVRRSAFRGNPPMRHGAPGMQKPPVSEATR